MIVVFLEGQAPLAIFTDERKCEAYVRAFEREFPEFWGMCRVAPFPCDPDIEPSSRRKVAASAH